MGTEYVLPLEAMVGTNFVKYEVLDKLMHYEYEHSSANEINIFIDLNSIIKPLLMSDNRFVMTSDLELSADIINMCGHYRNYYHRYLGANTNFFLVFGTNSPAESLQMSPGYNRSFQDKMNNTDPAIINIIRMNLNILGIVCKSLPNIYFYDIGNLEVSSYIEYILNYYKFNDKSVHPFIENMVITKDILPLQLVSSGCVILRPLKSKGFDMSFTVNHDSFWEFFIHKLRKLKMPLNYLVPPIYFANLLAMTGLPERNMSSIKAIPTAYNYLSKGIELGFLKNDGESYMQSTINQVLSMMGVSANFTSFELRWKAISSRFSAQCLIPLIPSLKKVELTNIHDPKGLKDLVIQYYKKSPIDLDNLNVGG